MSAADGVITGHTVFMHTPETEPLTAADRCDRCAAQAYVRSTMPGGIALLWCAHHWAEHGTRVTESAEHVHDETARLTRTG